MSTTMTNLVSVAKLLPAKSKDLLAEKLLASVDEPSQEELEAMWARELESIIEACEKGEMKTVPLAEVKRKFAHRSRE